MKQITTRCALPVYVNMRGDIMSQVILRDAMDVLKQKNVEMKT